MPQSSFRLQWRPWAAGVAGVVAFSAAVAVQNASLIAGRARPGLPPPPSWLDLLVRELPVWGTWLLSAPAVFWLCRRFPLARADWRSWAVHLLAGPPIGWANLAMLVAVRWALFPGDYRGATYPLVVGRMMQAYTILVLITYWLIVAAYHAWLYHRAYEARTLRASQLEALLAQAQLDTLRMQLHPHFLFNTLHSISALMAKDVPTARRMIARLSDLLRLSLDEDGAQEVPLAQELDFLRQYVELQRMRFGDRLTVELDAPEAALEVPVPRLVLQPLVENAIRHGVAKRARAGRVEVQARLEGGRLRITVADDGPGLPPGGAAALREGVGLRNTRARLAQLHGGAQRFAIADRPGGGVIVTLAVPARGADTPSPHARDDAPRDLDLGGSPS